MTNSRHGLTRLAIIRVTNKRGGELNVVNWILLGLLMHAVCTDMIQTRISNRLIVLGLALGFLFRFMTEGSKGVLFFVVNISIPVILLYLLFQMRALGAGDIKLFSMIGAFIATEQLLRIMVMSFVAGAVIGVMKLVYRRLFSGYIPGKLTQIHFSPAILIEFSFSAELIFFSNVHMLSFGSIAKKDLI